jgi:Co/Zn/Cd efflux system component
MSSSAHASQLAFRRAVRWVAILNFGYFGVEFAVALAIGSVALFADSIDFLEDTAVNGLILVAFSWSLRRRAAVGYLLATLLLIPGIATGWMAWQKFNLPVPPEPIPMSVTAFGALTINLICSFLLMRFREVKGSLSRAAFLSARNDVIANAAIMLAALVTTQWRSAWPDLVVGLGIFAINLGAARQVYRTARYEHRAT